MVSNKNNYSDKRNWATIRLILQNKAYIDNLSSVKKNKTKLNK